MKRLNFPNYTLTIIAALFLVLVSCEKEVQKETQFEEELELFSEDAFNTADIIDDALENKSGDFKCAQPFEICGDYKVYPLIASQWYYAGALIVYNDTENLYVTYLSMYRLSDFHLFVGDVEAMPLSGGNNPQIGHFPYTDETSWTRYKTFTIPLADVPECYTLAAHATVGSHTIWAKSCHNSTSFAEEFGGKRWGWVIKDCVEKCPEKDVLTAKIQLKNTTTAGTTWGVVSTGTPSPLFSAGWCDYMSVVGIEGTNTYDVIAPSYLGSVKIATMIVDNTGDNLNVSFVAELDNNMIEWSYVFVGTESELEALTTECPDYYNFPYSNTEWSTQHDFTIPLN